MLGCFSHVGLFATLWTEVLQTPLCIGFSGIEYWSRLPCFPPGDLPDPLIEPVCYVFLIGGWVIYHWATWEAPMYKYQEFAFLMSQQVMCCYWSRVHSLKTNSLSIIYLILELYIIIKKNQICAEKHILFHQKYRLLLSTFIK